MCREIAHWAVRRQDHGDYPMGQVLDALSVTLPLYSPLEPFLAKQGRPDEIEQVSPAQVLTGR
jgi:hypothetical protein